MTFGRKYVQYNEMSGLILWNCDWLKRNELQTEMTVQMVKSPFECIHCRANTVHLV